MKVGGQNYEENSRETPMTAQGLSLTFFVKAFVSILTFGFVQSSFADAYDDADPAYDRGDYETALEFIRPLAEQGEARAQNYLGYLYQNGEGVTKDYKEAIKWYRKAADQGQPDAQSTLGFMYHNGFVIAQDYQENTGGHQG